MVLNEHPALTTNRTTKHLPCPQPSKLREEKTKVLLARRLNNGKKINIVKDHIEGISTQDVVFTFVSLVRCQRKIQFFIVSLRLTTFAGDHLFFCLTILKELFIRKSAELAA